MLFLCETSSSDPKKMNDLICLRNWDYDKETTVEHIKRIISALLPVPSEEEKAAPEFKKGDKYYNDSLGEITIDKDDGGCSVWVNWKGGRTNINRHALRTFEKPSSQAVSSVTEEQIYNAVPYNIGSTVLADFEREEISKAIFSRLSSPVKNEAPKEQTVDPVKWEDQECGRCMLYKGDAEDHCMYSNCPNKDLSSPEYKQSLAEQKGGSK